MSVNLFKYVKHSISLKFVCLYNTSMFMRAYPFTTPVISSLCVEFSVIINMLMFKSLLCHNISNKMLKFSLLSYAVEKFYQISVVHISLQVGSQLVTLSVFVIVNGIAL